jgi:hypothetical protein
MNTHKIIAITLIVCIITAIVSFTVMNGFIFLDRIQGDKVRGFDTTNPISELDLQRSYAGESFLNQDGSLTIFFMPINFGQTDKRWPSHEKIFIEESEIPFYNKKDIGINFQTEYYAETIAPVKGKIVAQNISRDFFSKDYEKVIDAYRLQITFPKNVTQEQFDRIKKGDFYTTLQYIENVKLIVPIEYILIKDSQQYVCVVTESTLLNTKLSGTQIYDVKTKLTPIVASAAPQYKGKGSFVETSGEYFLIESGLTRYDEIVRISEADKCRESAGL